MLSRILVPLDGSELGDRILSFLDRLPQPQGVEVVLLRVLEQAGDDATGAVQHLGALVDKLQDAGVHAVPLVTLGDAAEQILRWTALLQPKLVAMSTKGHGDAPGVGSVAFRVLERCPVPLLTGSVQSLPLDPGMGFARILVPLDGSEVSARVLPLVSAIARVQQSEVLLLLVDPRAESVEDVGVEDLAPYAQQLQRDGVQRVRTLARIGDEAAEILDVASQESVDLIALTSHSRPDKHRAYFGSVSEQVIQGSLAPLLLQRILPRGR